MTSANLRNMTASPVGSNVGNQREDLPPETIVLAAAPIALASGPMCWYRRLRYVLFNNEAGEAHDAFPDGGGRDTRAVLFGGFWTSWASRHSEMQCGIEKVQ